MRALIAAIVLSASVWVPSPTATSATPPNIVLILTDDQRFDSLSGMPRVRELLLKRGVTFTNAFASTPLCCPARASLLTGRYSLKTRVFDNEAPGGGVEAFNDTSTLATWLQSAGYTTSWIGKYLNGYEKQTGNRIPPGWDDWHALKPRTGAFFNYDLSSNGTRVSYGATPADYLTRVLADRAEAFIAARNEDPYFLMFTPFAPHGPADPDPIDAGLVGLFPPYRPPSFNVAAAAGSPAATYPALTSSGAAAIDSYYAKARASLVAVDRAVERIVKAVEQRGDLANTVFIYTSDNGLLIGEHRILGKIWPFEPSIRVPLIIRGPNMRQNVIEPRLVNNVDIPRTIGALTGTPLPPPQDGRNLLPLLTGAPTAWRDAIHLEWLGDRTNPLLPPRYFGVRESRYKFVQYAGGARELYDLWADPHEMTNLAGNPAYAQIEQRLLERLNRVDG